MDSRGLGHSPENRTAHSNDSPVEQFEREHPGAAAVRPLAVPRKGDGVRALGSPRPTALGVHPRSLDRATRRRLGSSYLEALLAQKKVTADDW